MTTINAMKFNQYTGAMVCDEQRHWNEERMKIYAADKILPIISSNAQKAYKIAAAYGNTGTSSIGDEIRLTLRAEISRLLHEHAQSETQRNPEFLTMPALAEKAFQILCQIKHQHIDDHLMARFGFTSQDFCRGFYHQGDKKIPIRQPDLVEKIHKIIAPDPDSTAPDAVFGNKGILAGYDQDNGFRIYSYSMREQFYEEVPVGFVAEGSGSDAVNFVLPTFFDDNRSAFEEGNIDPVDGCIALIDAVATASRKNMGVGGYLIIYLFDGQREPEQIFRQILDHRCRLITESIQAYRADFVSLDSTRDIVSGLLYQDKTLTWAEDVLFKSVPSKMRHRFHRFLRGYQTQWFE